MRGEVSNQDLLALYNACDIFVLTPKQREEWRDSRFRGIRSGVSRGQRLR